MQTSIVWLRADLRLEDNTALYEAAKLGPVIPLYIWDPKANGRWPLGAASRWWLHHSLTRLHKQFADWNVPLIIKEGMALQVLRSVIKESNAVRVTWNRRYEPDAIIHDAHVKAVLQEDGIDVQSYNGSLLFEPWTVANKQGRPFQVFTPFWKHCLSKKPDAPLPAPHMKSADRRPVSNSIASLELLPKIHWDTGLQEAWEPGEQAAHKLLKNFLRTGITSYATSRDIPACEGVSRLAPYLHFGEISPRIIWEVVKKRFPADPQVGEAYLRQIGWREFAHHLLYHFPKTPEKPLREEFAHFPWNEDKKELEAWRKGLTGYPIVDAGMRQLWHTGWMHNRVRMIAGSFLVKDLLISWTEGAKWFWDTLVDADLANNTLGWQWIGGCGADAAPYFRIFNPILQGEKFDPQGLYVKKWVPELSGMPERWVHRPWEAPSEVLQQAGLVNYPKPLVDHTVARQRALAAFAQIRQDKGILDKEK